MRPVIARCAAASLALAIVPLLVACGGDADRLRPAEGELPAAELPAAESTAPGPPAEPPEPSSPDSAAAIVRDYYAAVEGRDYARAYSLWSGDGAASGQTLDELRRGYAETESVGVEIGPPGRVEGAAGSRYVRLPVTVRATTRSGGRQCFRGTYTLRRSVVPGATAEQRLWRIASADLARCRDRPVPPADPGEGGTGTLPSAAVRVLERFGERLANVSLTAPRPAVRAAIREQYGRLVTPTLLRRWLDDPSSAPGRSVSSPWPERIEVVEVERLRPTRFRVVADVVYVTSVELASGGAADRERIVLELIRAADGRWRLDDYADACSAAAVAADLDEQAELPARVAATRAAIYEAATACDYAALDELVPWTSATASATAATLWTTGEPPRREATRSSDGWPSS